MYVCIYMYVYACGCFICVGVSDFVLTIIEDSIVELHVFLTLEGREEIDVRVRARVRACACQCIVCG